MCLTGLKGLALAAGGLRASWRPNFVGPKNPKLLNAKLPLKGLGFRVSKP